MERVIVLGRGGAGKTTAAQQLGDITGLPVVHLDAHFWLSNLTPTPPQQWAELQRVLAAAPRWIMDGDLGPYDVLEPRLARAEMVLILDFGVVRCTCRAARRSPERWDFWWWLPTWRWRSRRVVLHTVAEHARQADVHVLRTPRQLRQFLEERRGAPTTAPRSTGCSPRSRAWGPATRTGRRP